MSWAASIARGDGYLLDLTPEPTRYVVHGPLYPLLRAPAGFVAPLSVPVAKALTLVCGVVLLLLVHRLTARVAGAGPANVALLGFIGWIQLVSVTR